MLDWIEKLRKEWPAIKAAPGSFIIVCAVAVIALWTYFHLDYKGKLDDAQGQITEWTNTANRWRSDAEYYKDLTSRPVQQPIIPPQSSAANHEKVKPSDSSLQKPVAPKREKNKTSEPTSNITPPVTAPNGIAIGRDNYGNNTVNNGPIKRVLTPDQESRMMLSLGSPPSSIFEGIVCVMGDTEGCPFAQQLWNVFKKKNWDVGLQVGQIIAASPPSGTVIAISPEDSTAPPDGVQSVYQILSQAGVGVHVVRFQGIQKGHWSIVVGVLAA